MKKIINQRETNFDVNPIFPTRWSPRAMSGESILDNELMQLFEAARWAPSSYNNQSWRFLYAKKNTKNWNLFFNLLAEPNKTWCKNATVLLVIISKKTFDYNGKISKTHSFDTGSAWENLALQGSISGLVVHGMQGFDYNKAKTKLSIPDDFEVEVMVAIGKPGKKQDLPEELQKIESPNNRKDISEIVSEGKFAW